MTLRERVRASLSTDGEQTAVQLSERLEAPRRAVQTQLMALLREGSARRAGAMRMPQSKKPVTIWREQMGPRRPQVVRVMTRPVDTEFGLTCPLPPRRDRRVYVFPDVVCEVVWP